LIVSSAALLREFSAVINRRKFRAELVRSGTDVVRLQRELHRLVEIIESPPVRPASRDPDDDVVLAAAVASRADLIVSGDRDLWCCAAKQALR
jgi:putative PIN family toxin of toxin-antitoxin system